MAVLSCPSRRRFSGREPRSPGDEVSREELRAEGLGQTRCSGRANRHSRPAGQGPDVLVGLLKPLRHDGRQNEHRRRELPERGRDVPGRGGSAQVGDPPATLSQDKTEAEQAELECSCVLVGSASAQRSPIRCISHEPHTPLVL